MEFTIETTYDQKAITAMVRGIRKTLWRRQTKRTRIFGTVAILIGLLLIFSAEAVTLRRVVTFSAMAVMLLAMIFQDQINAYFTIKRGLPGLNRAVVRFREEGYHSATSVGESDFYYETIVSFIDAGDYFVFAFGPSHGQVYDKKTLTGGTVEEFAAFIAKKTGKQLVIV